MKKKVIIFLLSIICAFGVMFSAGCNTPTGKFYTLQEAYDNGFLTQEDLMSIAYFNNGGREYNEDIMDENYVPAPMNPTALSAETDMAIRQSYWDKYYKENTPTNRTIDDIGLGYYGTYNNCVAVKVYFGGFVIEIVRKDYVGGITVFYNCGEKISIWVKD